LWYKVLTEKYGIRDGQMESRGIEPLVGGNILIALGVRMNCAVVQ
jgi:hypothetical protein